MSKLTRDPCRIGPRHEANRRKGMSRLLRWAMAKPKPLHRRFEVTSLHVLVCPWIASRRVMEDSSAGEFGTTPLPLEHIGGTLKKLEVA